MLKIHFTGPDLARTRVAGGPDPMWELMLSLHQLQDRSGSWAFDDWRRSTTERLRATGVIRALSLLLPLAPTRGYFPDFLTPAEAGRGIEAGIDAIMSTPRPRLRMDVATLAAERRLPAWTRRLADGDADLLRDLGAALRAYHDVALAPYWDRIHNGVDSDRARRARSLLDGGYAELLDGLRPTVRWEAPVVEADYPEQQELWLNGRGLLLVPSFFCWGNPVALKDSSLPPVLVCPIDIGARRAGLASTNRSGDDDDPLGALLGRTRAAILETIGPGRTTTEIARRVGVSVASASQHATVLRRAGLLNSTRSGNTVLHTLTPLAARLLGTP